MQEFKGVIVNNLKDKIESSEIEFATKDLKELLGKVENFKWEDKKEEKTHQFKFNIDNNLAPYCFSVKVKNMGNTSSVIFSGYDVPCILHAVYTFLEKIGFTFEITGPVIPSRINLKNIQGWSETISPAIKKRGIRQHINFPMDISSYTLKEAKEYIHNLSRLRFNHITLHSYPGQWYECQLSEKKVKAGGFFYNQTHEIPDHSVLEKNINNDQYFCIPEIEKYFKNQEKRSQKAINWLRELIEEAKKVGLNVQFSVEPRDNKLEDGIKICKSVLKTYPQIDSLEIITQEAGGSGDKDLTAKQIYNKINIGKEILTLEKINKLLDEIPGQKPNLQVLKQLFHNYKIRKKLLENEDKKDLAPIHLGVYCTHHLTLKFVKHILKKLDSSLMKFTILPAHGARVVVESIKKMELKDKDLDRTLIYSWIEFDGSMYLQQNPIRGIKNLINYLEEHSEYSLGKIAFNHWRIAENRTGIRYASQICLQGNISAKDFYSSYAHRLGINKKDDYKNSMQLLDKVDENIRNNLFNIGFCYEGVWVRKGLGFIANWDQEDIENTIQQYQKVAEGLKGCLQSTEQKEGKNYLGLLLNRIKCSILHLKAMSKLTQLQSFYQIKQNRELTTSEKAKVINILQKASKLAEDYMVLHAEKIEDRGGEGTLISYYHTIPVVIEKIKSLFIDNKTDSSLKKEDSPPEPIDDN